MFVEVDSLQPTLSWEVFPRPIDLTVEKKIGFNKVTYDLRVWRAEGESYRDRFLQHPAEIVYERRGFREPSHTIEHPLKPSSMYFWSIRARFDLNGQPRVTQWGLTKLGRTAILRYVAHPFYYRLKTPSLEKIGTR